MTQVLDIVIVGAGPVGSLCANLLARHGHNIHLYEFRKDLRKTDQVQGRTINLALSIRGQIALKLLDLEETVLDHAIPMHGRLIHSSNGSQKIIPYDINTKKVVVLEHFKLLSDDLNRKLFIASEKLPNVNIYFEHKLIHVNFNETKLKFVRTTDQTEIEVNADLIIGADGAYSTVRQFMMKKSLFNFNQTYIEHGYLELCIPADENGKFAMNENFLHIWPREEFMMIALPNQNCTWTVTLFMPFDNFNRINDEEQLVDFFTCNFPDALDLIGRERLVKDFFATKASSLISIKCKPYHFGRNTLLIGDAAHAIVPFYGQGMNAGFEDCTILNSLFVNFHGRLELILDEFSVQRVRDAHAICDLAMYNYIEMRSLVNHRSYFFRKKFDEIMYRLFPKLWIPLYNSVTFTDMNYQKCITNRLWQDKIISHFFWFMAVLPVFFALLYWKLPTIM